MNDKITTLDELKHKVIAYMQARDWAQFHSPKNLSMSISIEAAELMEKFVWLTTQESKEFVTTNRQEVQEEIADIAIGVINFCTLYGIDITAAIANKMEINAKKYPVEKCKGKRDKYTKYV